jgi:hypothetical protein
VPVYASYLVIRGVNWMPNSKGIRLIGSRPIGGARYEVDVRNTVSGEQLYQRFINLEKYNVNETIECYASQNSGENIIVYSYIFAVVLRQL